MWLVVIAPKALLPKIGDDAAKPDFPPDLIYTFVLNNY
jgi:hypothetical protein